MAQPFNAFTTPDTIRLDMPHGQWIEVKRELSYGEQQDLIAATIVPESTKVGRDQAIQMDVSSFNVERFCAWLVDWSFHDADGKPVACDRTNIRNLRPAAAAMVDAALTRHVETLEEEAANPTGATTPAST